MLKSYEGFIMTKSEMRTVEGDIWWQFAKSRGTGAGIPAAAQIFEEHGYEVVPWDDNQIASDGSFAYTDGKEGKKV